MAFLIRTIDFTADGREIVRDRPIEAASVSIGRAAENTLHLPDLAVEQEHAQIEPVADGRLRITAVGTLGFTMDGRKIMQAEFDPHAGHEFAFGTYRLTVSQDGSEPVTITVRQVIDNEGAGDVVRSFALSNAMPGKRAMAWVGLGLILLAFLAVPIYSNLSREPVKPNYRIPGATKWDASWSTGKLSQAHHGLEDNCEACHAKPFESVRDETCLTCHEKIGDHAEIDRQNKGLGPLAPFDAMLWSVAETFGKEGQNSCTTCHTEHEGAGKMAATPQQFCADCHDGMDSRLTDTKLANAADFGTAHPQLQAVFHPQLGSKTTQRLPLDKKPVEQHGLRFPHELHLNPRGGVARMAGNLGAEEGYGDKLVCADCHTPTADKAGFLPVDMEEDCESCHSLVYDKVGPTFRTLRHGDVAQLRADLAAMDRAPRRPIVSNRRRPGEFGVGGVYFQEFGRPQRTLVGINQALSRDGVCGECHYPTSTNGRLDVMPVHLRSTYLLNGWFDHKEHDKEKCSTCHEADTSKTSNDLLLPEVAVCRECHLGEDARKAEVPSSCAMCHSYHPKKGSLPDNHPTRKRDTVALLGRKPG
ncbi:cytochrome c3 family protein [Altererythrobacter sp. H2]|uniref:cytochrome c3 family protein n=1 Tax=Altererythrobacter sp. H2 TaxID=3108391 RepID=UPI002B4BD2D1|nr:cytochrome c3 family protein [Altererythrobacter sp. H2]WRK95655.1 cytochrome c3 family protein [Altererythrobacter sp. H2]